LITFEEFALYLLLLPMTVIEIIHRNDSRLNLEDITKNLFEAFSHRGLPATLRDRETNADSLVLILLLSKLDLLV